MRYLIILVIIFAIAFLIDKNKKSKIVTNKSDNIYADAEIVNANSNDGAEITAQNYIRSNLLTKNEWSFYKALKPVAEKYNYSILSKVRVADLVEPKHNLQRSEWQTAFNKINKKHIDFILCNKDNLYPLLLIELDDNSHQNEKVKQRDEFIEALYKNTGYKLLRINGPANLEDKIVETLEINKL